MGNFCGECGEKIEPDMIYCPKCGAKTQYEYPQVRGGQTFTPPAYDFRQNTGIAPRTYPNVQPAYQPRSYNTGNGNKLGGASLACGLIGFCCFFGLPLGIIALHIITLEWKSNSVRTPLRVLYVWRSGRA